MGLPPIAVPGEINDPRQAPGLGPDEDKLALLGLHPAQIAVAHGLRSGIIHPQQVMDAVTTSPATSAATSPVNSSATSPAGSPAFTSPPIRSASPGNPGSLPPIAGPDVSAKLARDQAELERREQTGSGLEQFQQRHHILGTLARIGTGVGSALFPAIAANIPGTDLHHALLVNQSRGTVAEDLGEEEKEQQLADQEAQRQEAQARTRLVNAQANVAGNPKQGLTPEEITIHDLMTGENGQPRINPETSKPYTYLEAYQAVKQAAQDAKPTPADTQVKNKEKFQSVIAKVDAAGLSTDPKKLDKSLDLALKEGKITPEEHQAARGYLAANPTPSTNLTVRVEGAEGTEGTALDRAFTGKEVIVHNPDGSRVQMSYGDAKKKGVPLDRMTVLSANEAQANRDKNASVDATMSALRTYRNDFKTSAPKLTGDDRNAMRVLTADVETGRMAGLLAGLFDDIPLVGKINEYANKLIEGTITSAQYNQLSPDGKKLVNEYFNAAVSNLANMKATLGSVGRNPKQIQLEINKLPLPYLDWPSADGKFNLMRDDLRYRSSSLPQLQ
jgi:hypothetical protein